MYYPPNFGDGGAKTGGGAAMDLMDRPASGRGARRTQDGHEELIERIARAIREDGAVEPLEGLRLNRSSSPTGPVHGVSKPSFCVIAQGSKEVLLGDDRYRYDPSRYLIATAALPVSGRITEASEERPYLSLRLDLDPALIGSVMVVVGYPALRGHAAVRAIDVSPLDAGLLDAVLRLLGLLDSPAEEARFLRPLVTREIVFRLLRGEQSGRLHHVAALGGHGHRIVRALERLRKHL